MIDANDPRLTAYVLGELEDADRRVVQEAIERSADLQREVEAIRQSVARLNDFFQSEASPGLTAEQKVQLRVHAEPNAATAKRRGSNRARWSIAGLAMLGLLTIGVFVADSVFRSIRPTSVASSVEADNPSGRDNSVQGQESSGRKSVPSEKKSDSIVDKSFGVNDPPADVAGPSPTVGRPQTMPGKPPANQGNRQSPATKTPRIIITEEELRSDFFGHEANAQRSDVHRYEWHDSRGRPSVANGNFGAIPGMAGAGPAAMSGSMNDVLPGLPPGTASTPELGEIPDAAEEAGVGAVVDRPIAGDSMRSDTEPVPGTTASTPIPDFDRLETGIRSLNESDSPDQNDAILAPGQTGKWDVNVGERLVEDSIRRTERAIEEPQAATTASTGLSETREGARRAFSSEPVPALRGSNVTKEAAGGEDTTAKQAEPSARKPATSWRPAKATPNASRLMIGDHDDLGLEGMQTNVVIDGFRARVLMDLYFFNDRPQQLEGDFQLRLPDDASLYYFAFGQSSYEYRPQVDQLATKGFLSAELLRASGFDPEGILRARESSWSGVKEARVVARDKAAHAYSETVRRRVDPALVEWSGAGVFNARVFPLMPGKLHRIVVGYDVALQNTSNGFTYRLDLPEDVQQSIVDVNVAATPGTSVEMKPECRPFTSGGRAYYHIDPKNEKAIEVNMTMPGPTLLTGKEPGAGDSYFAARVTPDLPSDAAHVGSNQAIFLIDTSLSSRPEKFNLWLKLLENVLERNRDSIQEFAVLFFNIETHWWRDGFSANTDEHVQELMADCHSLSLEGATDVRQALAEAASPAWRGKVQNGAAARPDLFLLSDGAATWGELHAYRISDALAQEKAGPLFAYSTGLSGTATSLLEHLARETGGGLFSIASDAEIESAATAHRKRSWKLLDVTLGGASDVLVAGRPTYIYPGQPLTIVGRGEPMAGVTLQVSRGEERRTIDASFNHRLASELTPRAYGQVAVGQLEDLGSNLESVATAYARHFRVTGRTCSLLMLESEADYQRFQIKPEDDAFVVRSTPSAELITRKLDELVGKLADAKEAFLNRLNRLQKTPGLQFEIPAALQVLIDRLPKERFEVAVPRLVCKQRDRSGQSKELAAKLDSEPLDYDAITAQAADRQQKLGAADSLRLLSSLVERHPHDAVVVRDVAFSAMESGLSGQAYSLLENVAQLRPYEPQSYQLLAQCLAENGNGDLAMLYYEMVLNAAWNARYREVNRIVAVDYMRLLQRIKAGEIDCHAKDYAQARLGSLAAQSSLETADLVVILNWNTDRTDVDLHVVEPTGEECFYSHPRTQLGGEMTQDVTEGYGPEMYVLRKASPGQYKVLANYYATDANRTQVRSKAYVTVYENFGDAKRERVIKKTVILGEREQKLELATIKRASE